MGDFVFNVAKGLVNAYHERVNDSDPTNAVLVQVLFKVIEADATLRDYDTLAAILAGSNTECDFTNYVRNVLDDTEVVATVVDDTNDRRVASIDDWVIPNAGGTVDNTLVKIVICYDPDSTGGTDTDIIPLTGHDLNEATNGQQLTVAPTTVQEYFRAS